MAISVGSVEVDVIPNTQGIYQRLRSGLVPAATRAGEDAGRSAGRAFGPAMSGAVSDAIGTRIGQQIGSQIAARITAQIRDSLRDGITQGGQQARPAATRQGSDAGGAFARAMKTRLEAAFRSLPKIQIDANTSEADADLQALRVRMETLSGKRIGVDIDAAAARTEITDIEEQLRRLGAAHPDVTVRADTATAMAQLAAVREEIDRISARPGHIRLETDGTFGQRLRAAVQQAEASLPNINIGADTSPAQAEIASLRGQLTALRDQRVGIDIDAATAMARITEIQARLERLSASDADVDVRVDAANAMAQLAAVGALASALDAKRVNVNVNTAAAMAAVFQLSVAIAGLAAIPAIPVLAAGIGSIAAAGVAAGAGVGALAAVAVPAFVNIAGALQAQKAAQDAASAAAIRGAQATGQGASKALQMAGAQQALATAHRNAARQISQAEEGVEDAVRSSAEANRQAAQQVKAARQSLADAVQQAADRQRAAAEQVVQAEESLADAQRTARQAQQDLTQARADAVRQLADLSDRLANAQLSERDAVLDVQEAQSRLRATQAIGSKATVIEQQRAQLQYDQAVQRLKEQRAETKSLSDQKKAADKAGVEGSDLVKSAQQRVADAEAAVADQQQGLAKARQDAARQQVQNQRDIAAAQERVAEASRNVSKVQEDGARSVARAQESLVAAQQSAADSIASAQRQIASASQQAAGGVDQAAIAQAKYQKALAGMTPAARGTFNAFVQLRTVFGEWSRSLQPQVMPIFTRALNGLKNSLPGLTPFVEGAVRAITKLQDKVSQGFKSPWWKSFKTDLAGSVEPAVTGLGTSFGRVFVGMAGVVQAFLPHMDTISATMQRITGRFAEWGTGLKGSPEFERFLAYASGQGPILARAIGDISSAFYQVSKALAPLSGPVLEILGALGRGIASIAETLPWLIQGLYLAFIATRVWTLAMLAFNLVMNANPITLIIIGIVALVAAVVYAYKNFGWFRNLVQAVWAGIQTAALWAWNNVLKPVFSGIWSALQTVGRWATWLWSNVLGPVFGWIGEKAVWLWQSKIKPVWNAWRAGTGAVGAKVRELWDKFARPVFGWIGSRALWLWNNAIKPAWNAIQAGSRLLGAKFRELWDKYARPVFGWIADKGRWLWDKALRPAFDWIKKGVKSVGDSFRSAKEFIDKQWTQVQNIAKRPVRFVIDKVYNAGIVPTWNKIATAFGAPKIDPMKTKGWATGGVLPGYTPGKDVHQFYSPTGGGLALSGGEAIMRPEWTRAVGPGFVAAMNRLASTRGVSGVREALGGQQFKDGGIFSWIGKKAAGAGSAPWDTIKKGASWLKDSIESSARAGVKHLVDPLLKKLPGGETGFGKMIRRIPAKIIDSIFGYAKKADEKSVTALGSIGGTIPKGQHLAIINAALAAARVPPPGTTAQWQAGMNTLITRESGWNPRAINLWDINAKNGIPSQGLTQTIPPTFNAYVPKALKSRGILDPVANVAASIRYIVSRYGNITNVQQANASLPPKGYDSGGYLPPGISLVNNGTGRPEPVFTTAQANALTSMAARGGGADGPMEMTGTLVLDSGELMGTFKGVVRQENAQVLTALRARPRR
ncbi:transglycosylase SLT domain-containing protein [Streptomyces sp. NRRL F-5135]|uniref:transglycosylase SLT domain-containing protein n=1 Tax=Streptomyces sp. NRRL F-5135 TaxID=1463858 RepID=UPI0004C718CF|nr:transglycosylase SLT domain-containing protein [Streptomyces sp. NRRL F-5135]